MRNILNEVTLELEEKQITAHNMLPEGLTVQGNSSLLYSLFRCVEMYCGKCLFPYSGICRIAG
jgi:hypothetical protein